MTTMVYAIMVDQKGSLPICKSCFTYAMCSWLAALCICPSTEKDKARKSSFHASMHVILSAITGYRHETSLVRTPRGRIPARLLLLIPLRREQRPSVPVAFGPHLALSSVRICCRRRASKQPPHLNTRDHETYRSTSSQTQRCWPRPTVSCPVLYPASIRPWSNIRLWLTQAAGGKSGGCVVSATLCGTDTFGLAHHRSSWK
ncbi:hypothetical protein F4677DRAFT_205053 [Hypoxylon crocopeplum]|nr:hypothetical protein F4677DRAFT_205053 [Hypoxylon crocopeplum]